MSHTTPATPTTRATARRSVLRNCGLGLAALLAAACSTQGPPPDLPTVPYVDLNRYQGTWHEIARLPMWFQRGCVRSSAKYTLEAGGTVRVLNRCTTAEGAVKEAQGRAFVTDPQTNARLEVEFDNWFSRLFPGVARGPYWIVHLEPDYSGAVVGSPSREYLWILARDPVLPDDRYAALVALADQLGFATAALVRAPPP
jgi:apolipoprotein D and lipocalin family protein